MKQTKPQTLKGFRDFLPDSMRVRNYVVNVFKQVFESFGFQPVETPTLEYASTLMGKYGDEANKLIYTFQDRGNRRIGLRYDLTVPISKVLTIYKNKINLPFKRYQIQPVWRADKPQRGRYREFVQCDIDTFGSNSPVTDAEIIAILYTCLSKLGFSQFQININSRQVLNNLLNSAGIKKNKNPILQTLDKMDKIGSKRVTQELKNKGLSTATIKIILEQIKSIKPDQNLKSILNLVADFGIPKKFYNFNPTLIRGLDYYTGAIFETIITKPKNLPAVKQIGSICGGGRFDKLISQLGGPDIPAVGSSLGLDRIVDCIIDQNLLPKITQNSNTKVMVSVFDQVNLTNSIQLATKLTQSNINTFLYPQPDKLSKQFKYASAEKIPFVLVLGTDEAKNNTITLKNMTTGKQTTDGFKKIINIIKNKSY